MIHHVSIPARDPRHVAEVLAELLGGRTYPFVFPDSYMAVSGDKHGSMIEVYPESVVIEPGEGEGQARLVDAVKPGATAARGPVPFHILLSVPLEREAIERIGAREGWRNKFLGRGVPGEPPVFHVIELWIENRLMIEVATKSMAAAYTKALQFGALDRHFAALTASRPAA